MRDCKIGENSVYIRVSHIRIYKRCFYRINFLPLMDM